MAEREAGQTRKEKAVQYWTWWRRLYVWAACYFIGHRWKHSARPMVRTEHPPGWTRNSLGNPYYEKVSSWAVKCRRCRLKSEGWGWYPIWRETWWALRNFGSSFAIAWDCMSPWGSRTKPVEGRGYERRPWWLIFPCMANALTFGIVQGWGHFSDRRWFFCLPFDLCSPVEEWANDMYERHVVRYQWNPPGTPTVSGNFGGPAVTVVYPGTPTTTGGSGGPMREIGFWSEEGTEPKVRVWAA